ncbi:hypothetical protein FRB95_000554 [Tulasnella sp. JGI-2019a]|nr:hypothetical protein FRB95_000554 [Tulasnella sp. JGI-2019a]
MSSTSQSSTSISVSKRRGFFGFAKPSDSYLWLFFGGCMLLFSLARLEYIAPEVLRRKIAPGDWFWYNQKFYQVGMQLHLATVLPGGILSVFQFVPSIRNNYRQFHRISGRIAFTLLYISMIGALMIAPHAIGGSMSVQSIVWTLSFMTGYAVFKSWTYIRQRPRRIADHRKWALRAMFYMGSIITARVIMITAAVITKFVGTHYTVFRCDEVEFTLNEGNMSNVFSTKYPSCQGVAATSVVPVRADIGGTIEEIGSALRLSFGAALWLALTLHAIGVEYYINRTEPNVKRDQPSNSKQSDPLLKTS